jgi:thiamine kinase-like enzyme
MSIRNAIAHLSAAPIDFDLNRVGAAIERGLVEIPSVVTHGDFWAGNLLFVDGQLTGVVDWDSWEPAGVPGTDLLHLHAEMVRRKVGMSYGDMVVAEFWQQDAVKASVVGYLRNSRLPIVGPILDVIGHAWWLTTVAGALRRTPSLEHNQQWMSRNILIPGSFIADRII